MTLTGQNELLFGQFGPCGWQEIELQQNQLREKKEDETSNTGYPLSLNFDVAPTWKMEFTSILTHMSIKESVPVKHSASGLRGPLDDLILQLTLLGNRRYSVPGPGESWGGETLLISILTVVIFGLFGVSVLLRQDLPTKASLA